MKSIHPITVWVAGQEKAATLVGLTVVYDNLVDSATFHYALYSTTEEGDIVETTASGNLVMNSEEYAAWGQEADINMSAYVWACSKLNLTLV